MTKDELISVIRTYAPLSRQQVSSVLQALGEVLTTCRPGDRVPLPGIGVLHVESAPARRARNVKTGEPITIPSRVVVRLRPSNALKQAMNGGKG